VPQRSALRLLPTQAPASTTAPTLGRPVEHRAGNASRSCRDPAVAVRSCWSPPAGHVHGQLGPTRV